MMEILDWVEWVTRDEEGFWNGIREDAPEYIKEAYRQFAEAEEKAMNDCTKRMKK